MPRCPNRTCAAKTYGELAELATDLPGGALTAVQAGSTAAEEETLSARGTGTRPGRGPGSGAPVPGTAAIVIAIRVTISLAIWEFLYFWPIWVIGPWWTILLVHSLTGGHDDEDDTEPGPHGLPGR